ncbi:MAG TPA: 16S rRNA (cytidine(1402)-2'-O)-methyltransferase [Bryobacteraceae bacterium]|jgi:16S rRNA (cytidine1402-2'-O)-methyltransferase|nr:16S rRNA (cytidine(1402)-2'-O)-methyltransferase [Bryobacteraceae bacterium]
MPGVLYIVATPIGSLEDITLRALRVLREAGAIACEDTRQTRKLLNHYKISKHLLSYHQYNEAARAAELIERLSRGETIALVSDAGTPLVSDPGYRLVRAAIDAGIPVVPIPGPSALLAALAASGLGADAFRFGGFLPAKKTARRKMLQDLADQDCTLIFYEAPHRILEALEDIDELLGARPVVIGRELTKVHEEFLRGTAAEIRAALAARPAIKGEITLLIAKGEAAVDPASPGDAVAQLEQQGVSRMEAIKQVAKRRGISKRDLYRQLLK